MRGLLAANLNDLVDRCENPEKMLRQAIRDMETALGRLMDGAARAIAHQRLLGRQLEAEQQTIGRCAQAAETAVHRDDDDAARRALRHKAEHQRLAEALALQTTRAEVLSDRLRNQVTAMRIKLAEARRKLLEVSARHQAVVAQRQFLEHVPAANGAQAAWSTFERACTRIEETEAETEALLELIGDADLEEPLDTEVEAELRALKEATSHVTT
jgi:phage shock protein A